MEELLTTREAAVELQFSASSIKRWCVQGLIRTKRTAGGHRRIERSGLQEFLAMSAASGMVHPDKDGSPIKWGPARVAEAAEGYSTCLRQEFVQRFQQAVVAGE